MVELPDKAAHFFDWYLAALEAAELTDKRYPVKGMNVWTPYGFLARRQMDRILVEEIERSGSNPVEFPALIPQTEFQKEKEHIKGFDAQVYWVTRGGATELDVPLVLRPTSETAMYPMFALWVRSHQDLPLTVYQIVNTFRYETKTTRPFLRVREIHFFEEHTCQADEAAASARVDANLASFAEMARRMALPYLAVRRPDWDKFPGAYYSIALDIPVGEARTLQIGSVHHYRENFSGPYGIRYEAADGSSHLVHQTTFGLSERLLGAVVALHGDGRGVVFPTEIAPYEVVIVPIPGKNGPDPAPWAREIAGRLAARGVRVHLDLREGRPGAKYYHWESRGVPLRLEVGGREATARSASAVDRLGNRATVGPESLEAAVDGLLRAFDRTLAERARAAFAAAFAPAATLADLTGSTKVRVFGWCGKEPCGHAIETAIEGALLGAVVGSPPGTDEPPRACLVCGTTTGILWAAAGRPL
ncbi:MAG: aminoacyl--tRNA ligase-related protein [Thermoplasmata archaeon]